MHFYERSYRRGSLLGKQVFSYDGLKRISGHTQISDYMGRAVNSKFVYNANSQLTAQSYLSLNNASRPLLPQAQHYYDEYNRYHYSAYTWSGSSAGKLNKSVEYATNSLAGKPQQTTRVKKFTLRYGVQNESLAADEQYSYEYDALGNIIKIEQRLGGRLSETTHYTYDALGQLQNSYTTNAAGVRIRGEQYTYAYDANEGYQGNIAVAEKNGKIYNYAYSAEWSDLLTGITDETGETVRSYTYDTIGNPLSDGTRSYQWSYGRCLTKVSKGGSTVASYTYDGGGERIGKTAGGVTYEYWMEDGRLLSEKQSGSRSATLNYYYGQDGLEYIEHNGESYWALKNPQGDITGLAKINADGSGTLVCRYTYSSFGELLGVTDASGNPISDSGHIANLNPFRYRGYYYDAETGFYRTGTRYYDPVIGRWISPDDTDVMLEHLGDSILATNLYAYCLNNPINYADPDGEFAAAAGALAWGAAAGGSNFWNPVGWVVLGATAVGVGIWAGVKIYKNQKAKKATISQINNNNMNKKVKDILKTKKGSIKNAKPPKGSPSWSEIAELTLAEIYRRAQRGDTGFNYFKKLLTDGRFNK